MWSKEVFCPKCRKVIDVMTVTERDAEGQGLAEAMILGDSSAIHRRQTGCDVHGWYFGPWVEEKEKRDEEGELKNYDSYAAERRAEI
jgi:hypothetical protein